MHNFMWTGRGGSFPPESNATGNVKSHDAQMFFDEEKNLWIEGYGNNSGKKSIHQKKAPKIKGSNC